MAEETRKVSVGDVVKVLAKHSAAPSDPDDAETLRLYNEQAAEAQGGEQQEKGPQRRGA
jgi:hypothetical protein